MAKNQIACGDIFDVPGPSGGVLSGGVVVLTDIIGVAVTDIAVGVIGAVAIDGVFELPKATGAMAQGKKVYWDATAGNITATATANTFAGYVYVAALSGDATVQVRLIG